MVSCSKSTSVDCMSIADVPAIVGVVALAFTLTYFIATWVSISYVGYCGLAEGTPVILVIVALMSPSKLELKIIRSILSWVLSAVSKDIVVSGALYIIVPIFILSAFTSKFKPEDHNACMYE